MVFGNFYSTELFIEIKLGVGLDPRVVIVMPEETLPVLLSLTEIDSAILWVRAKLPTA